MDELDTLLEVRQTPNMGRGVFARASISEGSYLVRCEGWLVAGDKLDDRWHAMQVGPDLWLCSEGNCLDECINHSCDPNAGFVTGEPVLYALRDIVEGEQITWDYSTSIAEGGWALECRCNTSKCRRVVRSWWELSAAERAILRPSALTYLREEEGA